MTQPQPPKSTHKTFPRPFPRNIPIHNSSPMAQEETHSEEDNAGELPPENMPSTATTTTTATKTPHLPIELWMRVLESLSHEDTLARPAYVNCFIKAIIQRDATEEDLVGLLPEFERRAWKTTRPYYAINSTIRKAAQQVFLSGVILQTCVAPLTEMPQKRKGKRTPRRMKGLTPCCVSFPLPALCSYGSSVCFSRDHMQRRKYTLLAAYRHPAILIFTGRPTHDCSQLTLQPFPRDSNTHLTTTIQPCDSQKTLHSAMPGLEGRRIPIINESL
jgi:hypothetical protein